MALYNKNGKKFEHLVEIDRDPNQPTTYTHKFPVFDPRKNIVDERWSTKVRPIKSMTALLQGMRLRRHHDYMIDYNNDTKKYEYWFFDHSHAVWFALVCGGMKQQMSQTGYKFNIVCPHCQKDFPSQDITWK